MKIAIVPFHSGLANDILFDKDNESTNSDDLITPYYYIKQEYEKRGVSINTLDQYNTLASLDCVLFFKLDYNELIRCIKSKVKRLYYFAWEPEVVDNHHSKKNLAKLEPFFNVIFTWNDDIVDGNKYLKINYPYHFTNVIECPTRENFEKRNLLVNISGNKISFQHNELYSVRRKVISFYNKYSCTYFSLYGRGWLKNLRVYKGVCISKKKVYTQFKFALCLENMCNVNGYVTEKIFDCFTAGIVPVYWGASNIEKYIPKQCFISYTDFSSIDDLNHFLINMSYEEYCNYICHIKEYLQSSAKSVFEYKYFMRQLDSALISNIERECNNEVALAFYSILQNISRKPKALFNLTTKLIVDYCM